MHFNKLLRLLFYSSLLSICSSLFFCPGSAMKPAGEYCEQRFREIPAHVQRNFRFRV